MGSASPLSGSCRFNAPPAATTVTTFPITTGSIPPTARLAILSSSRTPPSSAASAFDRSCRQSHVERTSLVSGGEAGSKVQIPGLVHLVEETPGQCRQRHGVSGCAEDDLVPR